MAHWGIALASGPHINFPLVPPPAAELAWKELALAQQNAKRASPVERDLIEALSHRYANPQPEDRAPLDQAYADAMRKVWQTYPDDPDVGAFFAEAMMDLAPMGPMDAGRSAESRNRRNSRDARRGHEAQSQASVRQPSLHPRGRSFAASRARRCRRRTSADSAARSCAQRSHAVAYRHSPRPLAAGDRHQRQRNRSRSPLPADRGHAEGSDSALRCAQPPHARLRRDDDRPARAGDETHSRHGGGISAGFPQGKRHAGGGICRHAARSACPLRALG